MPSSWICRTLGTADRTRKGKHSRDEASSNYRPSEKQAEDAGHAAASKIGIKTGQQYGRTDRRKKGKGKVGNRLCEMECRGCQGQPRWSRRSSHWPSRQLPVMGATTFTPDHREESGMGPAKLSCAQNCPY